MNELEKQIRKLGAAIPVNTGGTFEKDPLDAIIDAAIRVISGPSKNEFGSTLDEMDIDAFLNTRDWLEKALTDAGAKLEGGGIGMGRADVDISINGAPFNVNIRPLPISED